MKNYNTNSRKKKKKPNCTREACVMRLVFYITMILHYVLWMMLNK